MAFFLSGAEAILEMGEGEIANIASTALPYLERKVKDVGTSFVAKEIGQYTRNNPNGIVDMTLQKTYQQQNHKRNHPIKNGRRKRRI
jgi:hypothetical protein